MFVRTYILKLLGSIEKGRMRLWGRVAGGDGESCKRG
jgi:hypothetical protein